MVSTHSLHLDPQVAYEQTNPILGCSFLFRPYCAQILLSKGNRHDRLLQTGAPFVFAPWEVRAGPPFLQTIQLWIFLRGNGEE